MQYLQVTRTVMCGTGIHQRFTQDSPILMDVWALYLEHGPLYRASLLIEPWTATPPFQAAERIGQRLGQRLGDAARDAETVYNRTTIATRLTLIDLIVDVVPVTGWYIHLLRRRGAHGAPNARAGRGAPRSPATSEQPPLLPTPPNAEQMWDDIVRRSATTTYPYQELLAFVRIAGVIGFRAIHGEAGDAQLEQCLRMMASSKPGEADGARAQLAQFILAGLVEGLRLTAFPEPETKPLVYAVTRDRHAVLAVKHSVKTVKGDAASRLFNIDCNQITWAVMDCGIDAMHPAFLDRSQLTEPDEDPDDPGERLKYTRVTETYDFTHLRDVLLGREKNLPEHFLANVEDRDERMNEIKRRISKSQSVDWELLRPVLKVPCDRDHYVAPEDSHGTHVAGILGGNWPRSGDPLMGMCRDIRIIDLRVCREDGTSDEFIIISALQFLRHLNSNADSPYIFGVNMSLSIPHDPTAFACGQTPVCVEAERTVASGVVVVAAAGNLGYRRVLDEYSCAIEQFCAVSITDPGNAEGVITVGSTHRIEPHTYGVSYFSSRGPTGDGRNKPDLLAPGEKIVGPAVGDKTLALDGTSMAAPHVSGAAALLMARHIELKLQPGRIKTILCSTATDLGRERYFQGCGLVDVLRALQSV